MTVPNPGHDQINVARGGKVIQVDAGLKDLLQAVWLRGLDTIWSCQGTDISPGYLAFTSVADAGWFLGCLLASGLHDEVQGLCQMQPLLATNGEQNLLVIKNDTAEFRHWGATAAVALQGFTRLQDGATQVVVYFPSHARDAIAAAVNASDPPALSSEDQMFLGLLVATWVADGETERANTLRQIADGYWHVENDLVQHWPQS